MEEEAEIFIASIEKSYLPLQMQRNNRELVVIY